MVKKHYKVDLSGHLADCDANYVRLLRLLPELDEGNHYQFAFDNAESVIDCLVCECAPYTTTLRIWQKGKRWGGMPTLTVRLYHDMRMAEVIACEQHRHLKPRYEYPNPDLLHKDEKAQLNRFLGEWLSQCLRYGYEPLEILV